MQLCCPRPYSTELHRSSAAKNAAQDDNGIDGVRPNFETLLLLLANREQFYFKNQRVAGANVGASAAISIS